MYMYVYVCICICIYVYTNISFTKNDGHIDFTIWKILLLDLQ